MHIFFKKKQKHYFLINIFLFTYHKTWTMAQNNDGLVTFNDIYAIQSTAQKYRAQFSFCSIECLFTNFKK